MKSSEPIGIFDSGVGGLTVAKAVKGVLPNEQIIYFGDTAHLPYGDKSVAAIQAYSIKIINYLLESNCKVILIACNSASSAALELIKEYVGEKALIINVIDPIVNFLRENYTKINIGLIGTKQTVNSGVYQHKIEALNNNLALHSLATPLLVPMIEEGFYQNKISHEIIRQYLSDKILSDIEVLILGCTHYPVIKNEILNILKKTIDVLDSAELTAGALKAMLELNNLQNKSTDNLKDIFLVSDYTEAMNNSTKIFFGDNVSLQCHKI